MILPPEKSQGLLNTKDGRSRETEALPSSSPRVYQPSGLSPTFPAEKAPTPPPIRLEYHPESSSSSRAIVPPTFPTSFDSNPPPPSYYSDGFANAASSSHFSSASSINNTTMPVPMAQPAPAPGSHPSFARAPSREVTYPSFPPMFLVATGKSLAKGFPYTSPPSNSNPHPFTSHDVYEGDWMGFLQEVQMVAALSRKQIELSEHLPIVSIVPIVRNLASYGVQQLMKHQNASKVIDCIDKWNRHFFEQRKVRIILMKGPARVSGQKEYQNDIPQATSSSSTSKIESDQKYYNSHPPPSPSNPSISQILTGVDDDVYRLFIVPLS